METAERTDLPTLVRAVGEDNILKDEASAKAAAPSPGTDMGLGVTITTVEFREVLANA